MDFTCFSQPSDDFINTLIQIQTTLSAVSIAIISLITPHIGHKVFGVDFADYVVNRKHKYLNQINVIIVIICCTVVSVLLLALNCLRLVWLSFFINIWLLIFELYQIRLVFIDEQKQQDMICEYLKKYLFKDYDALSHFYNTSLNEDISRWPKDRQDKYVSEALNLWEVFLTKPYNLEEFQQYKNLLVDLIKGLLFCGNKRIKCIALDCVVKVYAVLKKAEGRFELTLFQSVRYDIFDNLGELEYDGLKQAIVYIPCSFLCSEARIRNEDKQVIEEYLYYLPFVLRTKSKIVNADALLIEFGRYLCLHMNDSSCQGNTCVHRFFISLVKNGYKEVIQKSFFDKYSGNVNSSASAYQRLIVILYMYYAAFTEEEKYLTGGKKEKKLARLLLMVNGKYIKEFIYDCFDSGLIKNDLLRQLEKNLHWYELQTIKEEPKFIIAKDIAREFVVLNMAVHFQLVNCLIQELKLLITSNCFAYYNYFVSGNKKESICNKLRHIASGYGDKTVVQIADRQIEVIYNNLCEAICKIYADGEFKDAKDKDSTIDEQILEKELIGELTYILSEQIAYLGLNNRLNSERKRIIDNRKYKIFSLQTSISFVNEKDLVSLFDADIMLCRLIKWTIPYQMLNRCQCIGDVNKLVDFMQSITDDDVFVGESPVRFLYNSKWYIDIHSLWNKIRKITGNLGNEIVLLNRKNVCIELGDVEVVIRKLNEAEIKENITEKDGLCFAVATNDIRLPYSEDKAKEYIYNKNRIIEIYANLNIEYVGEQIGSIIKIELTE